MRGEMRGSPKSYVIALIIIALVGLVYVLVFGFHSTFFVKSLVLP
jgi:Na+/proline symporter